MPAAAAPQPGDTPSQLRDMPSQLQDLIAQHTCADGDMRALSRLQRCLPAAHERPRSAVDWLHENVDDPDLLHHLLEFRAPERDVAALVARDASLARDLDMWHRVPLHTAVVFAAPLGVLRAVLHAFPGAAVVRDIFGKTPLHCAVSDVSRDLESYASVHCVLNRYGLPAPAAPGPAAQLARVRAIVDANRAALWTTNDWEAPGVDLPLHTALLHGESLAVVEILAGGDNSCMRVACARNSTLLCAVTGDACLASDCYLPVLRFLVSKFPGELRRMHRDTRHTPASSAGTCTSALHEAVRCGLPIAVVRLLAASAPALLCMCDSRGFTPLMYAASSDDYDSDAVVHLLAEASPESVLVCDADGRSALFLALHAHILSRMLEAQGSLRHATRPMPEGATSPTHLGRHWQIIGTLMEAGPDMMLMPTKSEDVASHGDVSEQTPLHVAVAHLDDASQRMVEWLASKGPDAIRAQDYDGRTPLHHALRRMDRRGADDSLVLFLARANPSAVAVRDGKSLDALSLLDTLELAPGVAVSLRAKLEAIVASAGC